MTTERLQPNCCLGCENRWSGLRISHCAECHRTFTTPANFDRHRAGSKDKQFHPGECSDPWLRGLVCNDRGYWSLPEQEPQP